MPDTLNDHSKRIIRGLMEVDIEKRTTVSDLESDAWLVEVGNLRAPAVEPADAKKGLTSHVPHHPKGASIHMMGVSAAEIKGAFSSVKSKSNLANIFKATKGFSSKLVHKAAHAIVEVEHAVEHAIHDGVEAVRRHSKVGEPDSKVGELNSKAGELADPAARSP